MPRWGREDNENGRECEGKEGGGEGGGRRGGEGRDTRIMKGPGT